MTKENALTLDPQNAAPYSTLANVISSDELAEKWITALENAHVSSFKPEVETNIALTLAMYVHRGNSPESSPLVKRLMHIYHDTQTQNKQLGTHEITIPDIARGYAEGVSGWFEKKFSTGDMNLAKSQARGDPMSAMLHLPESIPNTLQTIAEAGNAIKQHPEIVPNALLQLASQARLDFQAKSNQSVIETIASENPGRVIGVLMGTMSPEIVSAIADIANPTGKAEKTAELAEHLVDAARHPHHDIHSNLYALADLMGNGTVPPATKPMRDFSDWMQFNDFLRTDKSSVIYNVDPTRNNFIDSKLVDGKLSFTIFAKEHKNEFGRGDETFMSMVKKYQLNGQDITAIQANWNGNDFLRTNHDQFLRALQDHEPYIAAKKTFTGEMACRLALTEVCFPGDQLSPVFRHPDWGAGDQMNNYSLTFARAHGRAKIETMPRLDELSGEPLAPINPELLDLIYALPVNQRHTVLERMHENHHAQEATVYNAISEHFSR